MVLSKQCISIDAIDLYMQRTTLNSIVKVTFSLIKGLQSQRNHSTAYLKPQYFSIITKRGKNKLGKDTIAAPKLTKNV